MCGSKPYIPPFESRVDPEPVLQIKVVADGTQTGVKVCPKRYPSPYGRSPLLDALPDIKKQSEALVNEMLHVAQPPERKWFSMAEGVAKIEPKQAMAGIEIPDQPRWWELWK